MNPRFIVRLEDGTDLPLDDVEALAREVDRGRVLETNLLFDSSTGRWETAGSVPLFRFLQEELAREKEEGAPDADRGAGAGAGIGEEGGAADEEDAAAAEDSAPVFDLDALDPVAGEPPGDPLSMDFSLAAPPNPPGPDLEDDSGEPASAPPPPEASSEPPREAPRWAAEEEDAAAAGAFQQPPAAIPDRPAPTSSTWSPPTARRTAGSAVPGGRGARREAAGGLTPRTRLLAGAGVAAGLLGVFLMFSSWPDANADEASGQGGSASSVPARDAPPPVLSDPLLERARAVRSGVREELTAYVEELRREGGVDEGPPAPWLSGLYFSGASRYPEVRDYWERYGEIVRHMRERGRALFMEGVHRHVAREHELSGEDRNRVTEYLVAEFDAASEVRERRYAGLEEVARGAVVMHDLLAAREDEIAHVPALGPGISPEPVLEARIGDPALQREVEALLDRILSPLTRPAVDGPVTRDHVLSVLLEDLVPG